MADEINMQRANDVYSALIGMLDRNDWKYMKDEDNLLISAVIQGDDLPITFVMLVNPNNEVIQFRSPLPSRIPEDKLFDAAVAVAVANFGIVDGSFDYDIRDGSIAYRLTTSYLGGSVSDELFGYMIGTAVSTVEDYNDKFFMFAKGMISLEDFIKDELE